MCGILIECLNLYMVFQKFRSLLRDLIPELILSQKLHIHMGTPRSPDLNPLDYHVWGYMKGMVYAHKVNTREELL
jgi:hypothetical protein